MIPPEQRAAFAANLSNALGNANPDDVDLARALVALMVDHGRETEQDTHSVTETPDSDGAVLVEHRITRRWRGWELEIFVQSDIRSHDDWYDAPPLLVELRKGEQRYTLADCIRLTEREWDVVEEAITSVRRRLEAARADRMIERAGGEEVVRG